MSVEFEKIVLEKLKVLDELKVEVSNLSRKVDENTTLIGNLTDKVEKLEEKVDENTTLIGNLTDKVEKLEEKVDENTTLIGDLTDKIEKLEEKVDIQGQNLANFENEFTIKVQALFDSFVSNTQSHLSYEKSIAALNAENFRQGARISKLEDYFNGAKILVTN